MDIRMQEQIGTLAIVAILLLAIAGCDGASSQSNAATSAAPGESSVLINVTSDFDEDPQAIDMAAKLAGFALDEDRKVAMFFNVRGVRVPTTTLDDAAAYEENDPIKEQLAALVERGAEIHVCPICMKALGVEEADIMEGAMVTTRPKLFAHIGPDTAVFSY